MKRLLDQIKLPSPIHQIQNEVLDQKQIKLFIKRDDLIHPIVSGNKWRKLKYNLIHALANQNSPIVTFGGPFSNHLYAVAGSCHELGIKCIGIVRGEIDINNPTLKFCIEHNMKLVSCTRSEYREATNSEWFKEFIKSYPHAYIVPEGGTNALALDGVGELWTEIKSQFDKLPDFTCVAIGTGGTCAGILGQMTDECQLIGYSALKTDHLYNEICGLLNVDSKINLYVKTKYHFGGYGKTDFTLLSFIYKFEKDNNIPLDPIYTGKAMFGLFTDIEQGKYPPGSTILFIHTGGLQGINGINYLSNK